jgi:hypothetical protein
MADTPQLGELEQPILLTICGSADAYGLSIRAAWLDPIVALRNE